MNGLAIVLFLAPLFLHFGVAAQAMGYYLFILLIPLVFFSRSCGLTSVPLKTWALCLLGLYCIFPLTNIVNLITPVGESIRGVATWPVEDKTVYLKLTKSLSSSSFLVTAVILLLFLLFQGKLASAKAAEGQSKAFFSRPLSFEKAEKIVLFGFLFAATVLMGFVVNELFTGQLFRTRQSQNEFLLQFGGLYRVMGFSANPLHFSGITLALLACFWSWFWLEIQSYRQSRKGVCFLLLILSLFYLSMVLMSGGRTAVGTSALILCFPLLLKTHKNKFILWAKLGYVAVACGAVVTVWKSGFLARFVNSFQNLLSGQLDDIRFKVWALHWKVFKENPIFGQGYFELAHLDWRDHYYDVLYPDISEEMQFSSHNQYLETLATSGLFGMVSTVLLLGLFLKSFYGFVKQEAQGKYFTILSVMLLANLIHGLTENSLYTSTVTYAYFYMTGIFTTLVLVKKYSCSQDPQLKCTA